MAVIKIAPSILSADFGVLAEEIARVEAAGADQIHIDVMDGRFVPNITMGFPILDAIRKRTRLPLDLHLMIVEPEKYLAEFAARGADMLTVHVEVCSHLQRTLASIHELIGRRGSPVKAGAALNPATTPATIEWVKDDLDLVLVMSVNPGFGGQTFIRPSIDKIARARRMLNDAGSRATLEVDGGINRETIAECWRAGADTFVAGNAVFSAKDPGAEIAALRAQCVHRA
jgi:ribulose-phosphate 3-epimerase